MDDRERKLGENEAAFRAFNTGVRQVERTLGTTGEAEFVCECSNPGCEQRIRMPLTEYARLREDPIRFVIKRGHEVAALERVVSERDDYVIIEKRPGAAADAARGRPD